MRTLAFLVAAASAHAPTCNAHPAYALRALVVRLPVTPAGRGRYEAAARVSFVVETTQRAHVPAGNAAMRDHARGHETIALRYARDSAGTVTAIRATPAAAARALAVAIAQFSQQTGSELQREETLYDAVTSDGATQDEGPRYGFPGGPDATEPCGRPFGSRAPATSSD
ncbi:MAG: hypothetical protein ACYDG0_10415 [Vulcanimicrobiaceae bacterium]